MQNLAITWLGHSSFRVRTPGGKELLFDPWYTGNPTFPESARPVRVAAAFNLALPGFCLNLMRSSRKADSKV